MRTFELSFFANTGSSWIEKFNGVWTPLVLVILGVISFFLPFLTAPTVCWAPAEMTSAMVSFINHKCWQNNFIQYELNNDFVDFDELFIKPVVHDSSTGTSYTRTLYQWLPVILIFQALFFAVPYILWKSLVSSSGMNINKMYGMAEGYSQLSAQDRKSVGQQLARYLNQWLEAAPLKGIPWGVLTFISIFIKILFLVNISTQYTLFDRFLKAENINSYGTQLLRNLIDKNGTVWQDSPAFPKSVFCEFQIRKLQNVQYWTMECFLYMNVYYEMVSIFVWLWLCFTQIATATSCVLYGLNIIIPVFRTRFVRRHLLASLNLPGQPNENDISRFAGSTLGQDGVTVLRWISKVSSDLLVVDTIEHLWQIHHRGVDPPTVQQPWAMVPNRPVVRSYTVAQPPPPTETLPTYNADASHGNENIPLMANPTAPSLYPKAT